MAIVDRVFVVVRFDTYGESSFSVDDAELQFTVIEAFPDRESAMREVERLNVLNGHKGWRYSFQSARWYPLGRQISTLEE